MISMVTKRKEGGELEEVRWGLSTKTFRTALIVLVVSMHPVGRQILETFGFQFPDQKKITVAADESHALRSDVDSLKSDVRDIRANHIIINQKLDKLDNIFTGFQIDFDKYRRQSNPSASPSASPSPAPQP